MENRVHQLSPGHESDFRMFVKKFEELAGRPMPAEDLRIWREIIQYREFPAKTTLLRAGSMPSEYYFTIEGLSRQYYLDMDGSEVTRGFAWEGEFVCTEVLIQGRSAAYSIETLEPCRFFACNLADLDSFRFSVFYKDVTIAAMANNLRRRMIREANFLMMSSTERYEAFLDAYPFLKNRVKQSYLASYLGMTPESLSRVRRAIKER